MNIKIQRSAAGCIITGILLAIVIEILLALSAAGHGYGATERLLTLQPDSVSDYEITGNHFQVSGATPSIVLKAGKALGYIDIYFSEPLLADTDVIVYYLSDNNEDEAFDRFQRIERYMVRGTLHGRIPIPSGNGHQLRLDIRGSFVLNRLEAGISVTFTELSPAVVYKQIKPWRLAFFALILSASFCLAYTKKGLRERQAAAPSPSSHHVAYLDGVRVAATFLVIAVHVVEPLAAGLFPGSFWRVAIDGSVIFFLTCNLLFILLSGALLLPFKEESVGVFFRKRVLRVVLPLIVYSFFYLKLTCASQNMGFSWVPYIITSLLSGHIKTGPHLWLIYKLIGVYLAAVPLRYMLKSMPEKAEKQLTCMIFVFMGLETASSFAGIPLGFSVFLNSWPGVFLMGYLLTKAWMRQYDNALLAGGIISFALSVYLSVTMSNYSALVANCSILMLFMSSALFVLIMKGEALLRKIQPILTFVSRYSYAVLLIHWFVLSTIIYNGCLSSSLSRTAQVVLPIILCFFLSLIIAIIVDHTILALAEEGLNRCLHFGKPKASDD